MPNVIKWEGAWVDRGNVLTTELNSFLNNTFSTVGTEIDNSINLDTFGILEINFTIPIAPTAKLTIGFFMITAPDGINYSSIPESFDRYTKLIGYVNVDDVTSAQRLIIEPFRLEPAKAKFFIRNDTTQSFASSGNIVKLYTNNFEVQ